MPSRRRIQQPSLWGDEASSFEPAAPLPVPERRVLGSSEHPVLVGTSGFSFPDWDGAFYPTGLATSARLAFYSRYFPAVEINSTYYGIPEPRSLSQMAAKTPEGFEFVIKANQQMTHEEHTPDAVFADFLRAIEPIREVGRFSGVLAQFPWRFRNVPKSVSQVFSMQDRLPGVPLFVEFRNDSWADEKVFAALAARGIGYCSVDEPTLQGLMPPVARATTDVAYVRFHGRNARNWWGAAEGLRYDYNYRREELEEWMAKIRELAERSKKTFVFFNNCHAGQAARNARLMMDMLQGDLG